MITLLFTFSSLAGSNEMEHDIMMEKNSHDIFLKAKCDALWENWQICPLLGDFNHSYKSKQLL